MDVQPMRISVHMDAALFRDFAWFDMLRVKKRWRPPALFSLILLVSALLCLSRYRVEEQAALLGAVLLVVGFGLPTVYFANFFVSIQQQSRKLGLQNKQQVYTVTLSDASDAIHVDGKDGASIDYEWEGIYGVFRKRNCTYLYVQPGRAFLLPDKDVDNAQKLKSIIRSKNPHERCRR